MNRQMAKHLRVDANRPDAAGVCDRCGEVWYLRDLRYQYEYAGTGTENLHLRVCPPCLDPPTDQLKAIVIPPDPKPVDDARTPNWYNQQNTTYNGSNYVVPDV